MHRLPLAALLALLVSGCGESLAPVSGVLTDAAGEPVAGVTIGFQPVGKPQMEGSSGVTGSDGRYELRYMPDDRPGALPGVHKVVMTTIKPGQAIDERSPLPREMAPPRFRNGSVTFEVPPEGSDSADFQFR